MNVEKDEVLDVEWLAKKHNKKEKVIRNMIIIVNHFNYLDIEIEKIINDFYLCKML